MSRRGGGWGLFGLVMGGNGEGTGVGCGGVIEIDRGPLMEGKRCIGALRKWGEGFLLAVCGFLCRYSCDVWGILLLKLCSGRYRNAV